MRAEAAHPTDRTGAGVSGRGPALRRERRAYSKDRRGKDREISSWGIVQVCVETESRGRQMLKCTLRLVCRLP